MKLVDNGRMVTKLEISYLVRTFIIGMHAIRLSNESLRYLRAEDAQRPTADKVSRTSCLQVIKSARDRLKTPLSNELQTSRKLGAWLGI